MIHFLKLNQQRLQAATKGTIPTIGWFFSTNINPELYRCAYFIINCLLLLHYLNQNCNFLSIKYSKKVV